MITSFHKLFRMLFIKGILLISVSITTWGQLDSEAFVNPPDDSRPMTWMHMMNNNLSKKGLTKDLEGLAEAGVGGALIFSVDRSLPSGNVQYNSQEFRDIMKHGAREAERLGLRIGLHNCDGWSSSGGPWIEPKDAMKRVVWSEAVVEGGGSVEVHLPQAASRSNYYEDIAIVAYPSNQEELRTDFIQPKFACSEGEEVVQNLFDRDADTLAVLQNTEREKPWLSIEYPEPVTIRSLHMLHKNRHGSAVFSFSNDGVNFEKVIDLKSDFRPGKMYWAFEASFPEVRAKYFRIEFDTERNRPMTLCSIDLVPFVRIKNWLRQTSISKADDSELQQESQSSNLRYTPLHSIKIIEENANKEGVLKTQLPEGYWRVMRFGYTTTGAHNHPATDSGRGWECDKLDAKALDIHFDAFMEKVIEESGPLAGKSLYYSEIDSYEMGGQNWTHGLETILEDRLGYAFIPFLPMLAGRAIEDSTTVDAVLGDFRAVVASLMKENYFEHFTRRCNAHGLKTYVEPYGNGCFNDLEVGGTSDIPMGEFWLDSDNYMVDSAVYSARAYGKPIISAESFTSWKDLNWKVHPYLMKRAGDTAWIKGINEFMFHRFAHQANPHVAPGMTMGSVGSHIDRTQTWWNNGGKAWMKYLQRGSYLLRQGVPVSDILVYVGEGTPHGHPSKSDLGITQGYNMDWCDTHVLKHRIRVEEGRLVLPEGTTYSVLQLHNCEQLSLSTLERLKEIAEQGVKIIGLKPVAPLGYMERKVQSDAFSKLADIVWKNPSVLNVEKWTPALLKAHLEPDFIVLNQSEIEFIHRQIGSDDLYFFQNRLNEPQTFDCSFRVSGMIPEFWNAMDGSMTKPAMFTTGEDGRIEVPLTLEPYGSVFVVFRERLEDSLTPVKSITGTNAENVELTFNTEQELTLQTPRNGAYEVTLQNDEIHLVHVRSILPAIPVAGPWNVHFDGVGLIDCADVVFEALSDWKDHQRDDIRHFSGTAHYQKSIEVPETWMASDKRYYLDLGQVEVIAEVVINGKSVTTLWKPPFHADVTDSLKPGQNELLIKVTNLWTNRLIGDEKLEKTDGYDPKKPMPDWYLKNQPMPDGPRSTFTTFNFYANDHPLLPSGLLGPVMLKQERVVNVRKQEAK